MIYGFHQLTDLLTSPHTVSLGHPSMHTRHSAPALKPSTSKFTVLQVALSKEVHIKLVNYIRVHSCYGFTVVLPTLCGAASNLNATTPAMTSPGSDPDL